MKMCSKCKLHLSFTSFPSDRTKRDGLYSSCRKCHSKKTREYEKRNPIKVLEYKREYRKRNKFYETYLKAWRENNKDKIIKINIRSTKKRKQQLILATPPWVNILELKQVFNNCPAGYAVDHIIPILHKNVCGLNVPWNLQYLTKNENKRKTNQFPFDKETLDEEA